MGDLSNERAYNDWGFSDVKKEIFEQYRLNKNDIVVTRTATLGLNKLISDNLNAVYNNGIIRLRIDESKIFPIIVYNQLQSQDFKNYISKITGETSVRPNMKINYLLDYFIPVLGKEKQKQMYDILYPIFLLKEKLTCNNIILAKIRDTLLPKLLNGEIDISKINI